MGHVSSPMMEASHSQVNGALPKNISELSVFRNSIMTKPQVPSTEDNDSLHELEDVQVGSEATIKSFYEGQRLCGCCVNWVQDEPAQVPKSVEQQNNKAAIRIYKVNDHSVNGATYDGLTKLRHSAIDIQSPHILAVIRPMFAARGKITTDRQIIKISEPFEELFFAYHEIIDKHNQQKEGSEEHQHMRLLVELMREVFKNSAVEVKNLMEEGQMTFEHAWTLFSKRIVVYSVVDDQDRLFEVVSVKLEPQTPYSPTRWAVSCRCVQFDGVQYGFATSKLYIVAFEGNKPIKDLAVYPLCFHDDAKLEGKLVERGIKVLDYQHIISREYDGIAVDQAASKRYRINGRIVLDSFAYLRHNPALKIAVTPLGAQDADEDQTDANACASRHAKHHAIYHDPYYRGMNEPGDDSESRIRPTIEEQEANRKVVSSKRQYLSLLSPRLPGFALNSKQWLLFNVENIRPMRWNDEAYGHLVYREDHKDLLLTFVENHSKVSQKITDVISGKGEGLISLLSGPPGTGKTLSAEAIADKTRRPLYHLKAEELGINAETLGPNLSQALQLCTEWDAVLLLDEADVFLATRDSDNIARSELVSIFLRELEYFRGIMFLTTNLLSNIDEAFRSRIHIHLLYPKLSKGSRVAIWTKFLARLDARDGIDGIAVNIEGMGQERAVPVKNRISEKEIETLALWNLNGREIKNVVKTVQTWCVCKNFEMTLARLETGIQVTAPFAQKTYGDGDAYTRLTR